MVSFPPQLGDGYELWRSDPAPSFPGVQTPGFGFGLAERETKPAANSDSCLRAIMLGCLKSAVWSKPTSCLGGGFVVFLMNYKWI